MMEELAYSIAKKAHLGQVDKAGCDYIEHPKAVALLVKTDTEKAVAYLHDVIEDTDYTLEDLREAGLSEEIIEAVRLLTKSKNQTYEEYLALVKENELSRAVKIADLTHNSDLSRLPEITETDRLRYLKYQEAIRFLKGK